MLNPRTYLGGLLLLLVTGCTTPVPSAATSTPKSRFLYADAPIASGYPNSWTVLENIAYESAYDETFKNPAWVAYHLTGEPKPVGGRPRSGYPTDTRTVSKLAAADYPSGYDHGHMAPNSSIAKYFGAEAQIETFLMTNMLPQRHGLNAGPWKAVETSESNLVPALHDIWVICGPVYTTASHQPIVPANRYGIAQLCIPTACFKIAMWGTETGEVATVAFIMPQENASGHKPTEFLASIREIEQRTGLNFFSSLPQAKQDAIEETVATELWH